MNTEPTYPIDLITSYFSGESSPDDLEFLAAWLKADPQHRDFFESYRKTWLLLEKEKINSKVDMDLEWKELMKKVEMNTATIAKDGETVNSGIRYLFHQKAFRIAAIIILLLIPTIYLFFFLSGPRLKKLNADVAMIQGKLPDGSAVALNIGSSLEYPARFSEEKREVRLTGEAFFEVSHDNTKPFIISSGNIRVKVLGTSFYVNTNSGQDRMEVILSTGKVAVYYDNKQSGKVILAPGEKADILTDENQIYKSTNDDPNFISWKTRKLIFSNDPLVEIVKVLNKTYQSQIKIHDPAIAGCLVTATFDDQSLASVLNVLSATLNLKITQSGSQIEIYGKGCN
jgi:transmembrane sensor